MPIDIRPLAPDEFSRVGEIVVTATPSEHTVGFYLGRGYRPMAEPLPELFDLEPNDVHMSKPARQDDCTRSRSRSRLGLWVFRRGRIAAPPVGCRSCMSSVADISRLSTNIDISNLSSYAYIMLVVTSRDFGAVLRDARLRRGWTQQQLADRINTSRQWVIAFEHGKPSAEIGNVLRAVAALGIAVDIVQAPDMSGPVDLDDLLGDHR